MVHRRLSIPGNSGRRYDAVPVASDRGAHVRMPVTGNGGRALPSISDQLTADNAIALGLALIQAGTLAKAQHEALSAARGESA